MSPTFDAETTAYTATTTNATNKITATAQGSDAVITITVGDATVENGGTATWSAGENTVTVVVKNGTAEKTYTVTVTKQ